MPTTYAHYTFGVEVFELLDDELKQLISKNITLFNIGLHGPDILFYYGALGSNPIHKIGNELHRKNADSFFENAKKVINECSDADADAACAYIMGFICHFMLDSECHPYIRHEEINGISHGEIETEFDRVLMIKNHLNPISFKPTAHIIPGLDYAKCISWFYEDIDCEEVLKSLKSMKFYLNLLVAPGHLKRSIVIAGLRLTGNYESKIGLIMNYEQNSSCIKICENLQILFSKAVIPTSNILNEYYKELHGSEPINTRFHRNFE